MSSDIVRLIPKDDISASCPHCSKSAKLIRATVYPLRNMAYHAEQVTHCKHCKRTGFIVRTIHEQLFTNWKKHVYNVVEVKPQTSAETEEPQNVQESLNL